MLSELWELYETALLALVIWREARSEGELGMRAVACSIRNRVERPTWWGNSYASVISKKYQYSSIGAPGDPQLIRYPDMNDSAFAEALQIADMMIGDEPVANPVSGADSFFDDSISAPAWATPECFVGQVGRIKFFNVDRDYEAPRIPRAPTQTATEPAKPEPGPSGGILDWFKFKW